ncbi:MAG: ribonucleotide reductase N-terminal alpha domain-containing protein, partial [Gammaproteobacteria bacterium]
MKNPQPLASENPEEIPLQPASADIWDTKYRLKTKDGRVLDETVDTTWQRVARALAEVEAPALREQWYERFLWALRRGAIPAGRITSNAGAQAYKPATSTINCTVSGAIRDSMNDILEKVHEAGLTLKAGCVAPGTWVRTEQGLVTADRAVAERHERILCYDRASGGFEMRPILRHMTTHVPRAENIEIVSNGVALKTSIKHPVLVYRGEALTWVRADEVRRGDALVHRQLPWAASVATTSGAWLAGAHLGNGSGYKEWFTPRPGREDWEKRARALGTRFAFRLRAAERGIIERYSAFFEAFRGPKAQVVATPDGSPAWDYTAASYDASRAADVVDGQAGRKTVNVCIPAWIKARPECHFLPFLAGLLDANGTVGRERGSAFIATPSRCFAEELDSVLGLFGVHGAVTHREPRSHVLDGHVFRDNGGATLEISDSAFLVEVAKHMGNSAKKNCILEHATQAGHYDYYRLPAALREALAAE